MKVKSWRVEILPLKYLVSRNQAKIHVCSMRKCGRKMRGSWERREVEREVREKKIAEVGSF